MKWTKKYKGEAQHWQLKPEHKHDLSLDKDYETHDYNKQWQSGTENNYFIHSRGFIHKGLQPPIGG